MPTGCDGACSLPDSPRSLRYWCSFIRCGREFGPREVRCERQRANASERVTQPTFTPHRWSNERRCRTSTVAPQFYIVEYTELYRRCPARLTVHDACRSPACRRRCSARFFRVRSATRCSTTLPPSSTTSRLATGAARRGDGFGTRHFDPRQRSLAGARGASGLDSSLARTRIGPEGPC